VKQAQLEQAKPPVPTPPQERDSEEYSEDEDEVGNSDEVSDGVEMQDPD